MLHFKKVNYTLSSEARAMEDTIFIKDLEVKCLIGIFDWERKKKQKVRINLAFPSNIQKAARRDRIEDATDYKAIAKHTIRFVSESRYFLVETLAEKLAQSLLSKFSLPEVKLTISKPGAIRYAADVGIEITRFKKSRK